MSEYLYARTMYLARRDPGHLRALENEAADVLGSLSRSAMIVSSKWAEVRERDYRPSFRCSFEPSPISAALVGRQAINAAALAARLVVPTMDGAGAARRDPTAERRGAVRESIEALAAAGLDEAAIRAAIEPLLGGER